MANLTTCQQQPFNYGQEIDCTTRCHSQIHALELIAAVVRGNPAEIRSYCRYLCQNFAFLTDNFGRTLLHVAASCGKADIVQWLLENCHCEIDIKDKESGWTALHRALFYGQLTAARILLNRNSNAKILDHEGLFPIDIIIKDKLKNVEYRSSDPSEVYVWGSNSNFNLGLGNDLAREKPELLETFRRENISICKVILRKFHSVFLSNDGRVFTCGHGHGGRLGQNNETTILTPQIVKGFGSLRVKAVAAGQHHLVVLTEEGQIWTCGLNSYHQLGHLPPPERLLLPRPISMKLLKGFEMIGCSAAKYHSVIYTKEAVFTFGLNAGQLGHPMGEKTQILPRQVSSLISKEIQITHVEASDGATVCATSKGDVYVLHEYQCRKIASRQIGLKKICVVGGHLDPRCDVAGLHESGALELKVLLLTESGKLFLWREENLLLRRCLFLQRNPLVVSDVCFNTYTMGLVSKDGTAFIGHFTYKKGKYNDKRDEVLQSKTSSLQQSNREESEVGKVKNILAVGAKSLQQIPKKINSELKSQKESKSFTLPVFNLVPLLNHEECEVIKIAKVPLIYRGTGIECDTKGRTFATIQSHPKTCLYELPVPSPSVIAADFMRLYLETSVDDGIHDTIIKVGKSTFLGHRFILASRSDYFNKLISKSSAGNEEKLVLQIDIASPEIFKHILDYVYSNSCIFLKDKQELPNPGFLNQDEVEKYAKLYEDNIKKKKKKINVQNPNQTMLWNLIDTSKKLGFKSLAEKLQVVNIVDNKVKLQHNVSMPKMLFDNRKFSQFYDTCLRSEEEVDFPCHRCVLVARMPYFNSMFSSGWIEATLNKPVSIPLPSKILSVIIDYAYKDNSMKLYESEDAEFLCQVLAAADQYLIPRLKEICEVAVVDLITLKNVCELLELSYIYHAAQLKATCLQYICINLATLIEMESLNVLSFDVMTELTKAYRDVVPGMDKRYITPYSMSPTFEDLQRIALELPIDSEEEMCSPVVELKSKSKRRNQNRKLSERGNEEKEIYKHEVEQIRVAPVNCFTVAKTEPVITNNSVQSNKINHHIPFDGKWNINAPAVTDTPNLSSIMLAEAKALETKQLRSSRLNKKPVQKLITPSSPVGTVPKKAWGSNASSPTMVSLSEFLIKDSPPPKERQSPVKLNPWGNVHSVPSSPLSPTMPLATPVMDEILQEEQQIMQHAKTKSLDLIKIEEEAIQQLLKHYNAENNPEETITVSRIVPLRTPVPSWRKH